MRTTHGWLTEGPGAESDPPVARPPDPDISALSGDAAYRMPREILPDPTRHGSRLAASATLSRVNPRGYSNAPPPSTAPRSPPRRSAAGLIPPTRGSAHS